jgi:uncharacterized membrane protein YqjE
MDTAVHPRGVLASAKALVGTLIAIVATRVEILATELEEERLRLSSVVAWAACTLTFLALALIFLSVLVIVVFWDDHRILAVSGVTLVYLILGGISARQLMNHLARPSSLFSATLEELRKDRAGLQP